jgi:1-deoxy-D-xylulose 5-phosphate reductoisomerase
VEQFLAGHIAFTEIAAIVENVLGRARVQPLDSLDQALAADAAAREMALRLAAPATVR